MKIFLISLLLFTGVIFQTQLFSYSGNIIGDTKCSEINEITRYSNLSPTIITKIDLIGDRINEKYKLKDNVYKEKLYNLFEKVLNEHLQKTTYSGVQKEVLLRIGDYFVCKKEGLNIQKALEISNVKITNITDHSIKITWEGNNEVQTWLYVKKTGSIGIKHDASNNVYEYLQLGSNHEFTLFIQAKGSDIIKELDFKTLSNNTASEDTIINSEDTEDTINTTTGNTTNTSKNKYLEEVILPKCDANNPEVQFIKTNDDWKYINNENKRIFCVSPGNYRDLKNIQLTRSGTKDKRRYIVLNNGNDIHPGKLNKDQLANYALQFDSASYWTIDRASYTNPLKVGNAYEFINTSRYNILNRVFTNNISRSVRIINYSDNNTIQNCRFDTMTDGSRKSDMTAIELVPHGSREIKNTKIINNEIINTNDAFQMVSGRAENGKELNGEGTIIDNNHMYIKSDIYTDGKGNYTKSGKYAYAENAIDLKFGSSNPNNPVIITNNHFWGYRESDRTNSNVSSRGSALGMHYGVYNVIVENNVFFDSSIGIAGGDSKGFRWSQKDLDIIDNLFYDVGPHLSYFNSSAIQPHGTKNLVFEDNTIIKTRGEYFKVSYCEDVSFINNVVIDYEKGLLNSKMSGTNYFSPNKIYETAVEAGYTKDYTFITDKYTNNPRTITLKNVLKAD